MNDDKKISLLPKSNAAVARFISEYEFCITGPAFIYLLSKHYHFLRCIMPHVKIFARMAPKQKERVITELKTLGFTTLMCGDGTNDVGALKHADVGVALLSHPYDATIAEKTKKKEEGSGANVNPSQDQTNYSHSNSKNNLNPPSNLLKKALTQHSGRRTDAPAGARQIRHNAASSAAAKRFEQMMKDLEEEEKVQVVRLGDASIAAPFTSKYTSIQSICHVIKQGRCTLVTTLQMFKILALNALVLAYSQSVLYLDGIKFSDTQA
ncbi:unnamed protein product, partial [Gongylonema pulchrum]|uniref:P-type phospholipid transporter n=1 Tax=Gongylonema pulchrum TaxID=637853 RepID=A0A183ESA0_9BILA